MESKNVVKEKKKGVANKMQAIKLEKVVLNICAGAEQTQVKKANTLISAISGMKAAETTAKKRIATWKIRQGLPIGAKATIRGKKANELLKRLLEAMDNTLPKKSFTENGFCFGIKEYIDIPGVKYDPKVGIIGLDVCVSLSRPGYRVKWRKIKNHRLTKKHSVSAREATDFAINQLGVKVE